MSQPRSTSSKQERKRVASVYDAVAGRVNSHGFISKKAPLRRALPARPEEVLFRRKAAPDYAYAENRGDGERDYYWANVDLTPSQSLPDSDLLKVIHVYAADFYARALTTKGLGDFRSMDGTALLAMGILLEEAAKDCLGEKGHLVFVEGEEEGEDDEADEADEDEDEDEVHEDGDGNEDEEDVEASADHEVSEGELPHRSSMRSASSEAIEMAHTHQRKRRKLDVTSRAVSAD